jgi:hypothetical protein
MGRIIPTCHHARFITQQDSCGIVRNTPLNTKGGDERLLFFVKSGSAIGVTLATVNTLSKKDIGVRART